MAILDLLRRRRQDEDEEEEDAEATEGTEEDAEDETAGSGLLGRLNVISRLSRVFRRSGGNDDEDDDDEGADAEEAEDDLDKAAPRQSILSRWLGLFLGLGGFFRGLLRRGGGNNEDEDDEEDDEALPVAAAPALDTQPQLADGPEAAEPEVEEPDNDAGPPEDGDPATPTGQLETAGEEVAESGEHETVPGTQDPDAEVPPAARRLRELARSQEDVPVDELADDLHELLELLSGRGR